MTHTGSTLAAAILGRQVSILVSAMNAIVARSHNGELGTSKVIDMRRIAEQAVSAATPVMPLLTFRPTHRHRKGGLYRFLGLVRVEADLSLASIYEAEKGDLPWSRSKDEFEDGRFTALPADHDADDPLKTCLRSLPAQDLVDLLRECRPDLAIEIAT